MLKFPRGAGIVYTYKQGEKFSLETGEVIKGENNKNPLNLSETVLAKKIILRHQKELLQAWDQLKTGQQFGCKFFNHKQEYLDWMEE